MRRPQNVSQKSLSIFFAQSTHQSRPLLRRSSLVPLYTTSKQHLLLDSDFRIAGNFSAADSSCEYRSNFDNVILLWHGPQLTHWTYWAGRLPYVRRCRSCIHLVQMLCPAAFADQTVMNGVLRGLRQATALPSLVKSEPHIAVVQRRCMSGAPCQYLAHKDSAALRNIRCFVLELKSDQYLAFCSGEAA